MAEPILISCVACQVQVVIRDPQGWTSSQSGVYEIVCPRCDHVNQLWWATPTVLKADDLPLDSDKYFVDEAHLRRVKASEEAEEKRLRSEERKRLRDEERMRLNLEAEKVRQEKIERRKQNADAPDSDEWSGSNGGSSSNDDRSDSMNPNNDSYQASADNRSDQMNPNNDAYQSSRGH
jgi:hypothetical protein